MHSCESSLDIFLLCHSIKELNLEEGTLKAKKRLVSDAVDKTIVRPFVS